MIIRFLKRPEGLGFSAIPLPITFVQSMLTKTPEKPTMRDDFPAAIKEVLAKRVNYRCSNYKCRHPTSGPHVHPTKTVNIGVAAHLTAASPGGPRFDATLSAEQRKSAENGIWLCQKCAKLVDNDSVRYTLKVLQDWKRIAEATAIFELEGNADKEPNPIGVSSSHITIPNLYGLESGPDWPKNQGVYIATSSETIPLFPSALTGYRASGDRDYWGKPVAVSGAIRIFDGNDWEPIPDFPLTMNHCTDGVFMIRWRSANPDVLIATARGYHYSGVIYDTKTGTFGYMQGTNCEEPMFKFERTLNGSTANLVDVYYELKFWQASP